LKRQETGKKGGKRCGTKGKGEEKPFHLMSSPSEGGSCQRRKWGEKKRLRGKKEKKKKSKTGW